MICNHCGRKIGDNLKQCPECGMPTQNFNVPEEIDQEKSHDYKNNNLSFETMYEERSNGIGALVFGIISCMSGVFGIFFGLIGIVISIVALTRKVQPSTKAVVGFFLSLLSIPLFIIYLGVYYAVLRLIM